MKRMIAMAAGCLLVTLAAAERPSGAQLRPGERQIWDGVYTTAQAARGRGAYETSCGRCHNNSLVGSERAPALKGDEFWSHWEDATLDTLFTKIRDTMPAGGIETVADEGKLDILAFMLEANDIPPGKEELTLEPGTLESILVLKKGGELGGPAPNFSLVQTVGCLARAADDEFVLTSATEPAVTRDETPGAEALRTAQGQPLGSLEFSLLSVHPSQAAGSHVGHKMEARGLVFRRPGDSRLNLTSLQMLDARCTPP